MSSDNRVSCLFIDDSFIESTEGLQKGVLPADKVSHEPLIKNDQPWEVGWRTSYVNVIYDEADRLFKMWYNVGRRLGLERGQEADALAYAVSEDGLNWQKPIVNLVEDQGSKQNNLLFPFFRWAAGHSVMKDPLEADPAKRYKVLFMFQCEHMQFAGMVQPVCVGYSADGVHWEIPQHWVNPVIPEGSDTHLTSYWDPNLHRYVVFLRGRPNVRIICMSESEDYLTWSPRRIVIEPDDRDPPQDHEFYGMTALAYRDYRIGFLSIFHTLNESWIAQNQVEEWMPEWMNRMDIQLTYSKDGRNWHRAGNREPILECGAPGSYDCGSVYPAHAPLLIDDEIWLYHSGSNGLHGEPPRHGEEERCGINLAKIKKDRLVCLKTGQAGMLTTTAIKVRPQRMGLPLGIDPQRLSINADARGGSIRVEIMDPFDRVLPGFSVADCVPFTGDDIGHQIRWKSASRSAQSTSSSQGLEGKMVSQSLGILKVRVYLENAKLFALYFD